MGITERCRQETRKGQGQEKWRTGKGEIEDRDRVNGGQGQGKCRTDTG